MRLKKKFIGCFLTLSMITTLSMTAFAANYELGSGSSSMTFAGGITSADTVTPATDYVLTMTVNGVETKYTSGTDYSGYVVFTATPNQGVIGSLDTGDLADYGHRTALYVNQTGIVNEYSVLSAILNGTVSGSEVNGITVNSTSAGFSSIIVENNSGNGTTKLFSIKNSIFNALTDSDGSEACDFTGLGGVIGAYGDVSLTIDNVDVNTTGVAKVAFLADSGADMLVTDSTFSVLGGTLYEGYANNAAFNKMVAPPWVLGISGNARGTNLLGENSTSTFVDSDFETTAWGVLSVDAGLNGVINVINSTLTNISNTGYGIYAIGNSIESFYGTTFNVGTYPVILTGGSLLFTSSEGIDTYDTVNGLGETVYSDIESDEEDGITTVNSQFGVMAHNGGDITLEKDTVFNTKNAAFLIKNGVVDINVDDSVLNVEDGIILQMIDNDDSIVGVDGETSMATGVMPTFNTVFSEAEGYPTEAFIGTGEVSTPFGTTPAPEGYVYGAEDAVTATFTNVDLTGDMYNATGYLAQAKRLAVTLGEDATLKGAISASSAMHVQMEVGTDGYYYDYVTDANGNYVQATDFTIDEYYLLGHVANKAYTNGYNEVAVTLTDNAKWTVDDTSYLNSLTVGANASVVGDMTVDGVRTAVVAGGTYTGNIVLTASAVATTPNTTTTTATAVTAAKTGDTTQVMVWALICGISLLGAAYTYNKRKEIAEQFSK